MLASIYLTHQLSPSDFSSFGFFLATVNMLASYASIGLGVASAKIFASIESSKSASQVLPLWLTSLAFSTIAFFVLLLVPVKIITGDIDANQLFLALAVLFVSLDVVPSGAILGLGLYKKSSAVSFLACLVLFFLVGWAGFVKSKNVAILGLVLMSATQFIGNSALVLRLIGIKHIAKKAIYSAQNFRDIYGFAGIMFFVSLISASGPWVFGRLLIDSRDGAIQFSLYSIGMQWFSLGMFLPGIISRVFFSRMVKSAAVAESGSAYKASISGGVLATLLSSIIISALILIFFRWVPSIYGAGFAVDEKLVGFFLMAAIVTAPANTLGNALVAKNEHRFWLLLTVVSTAFYLVIGWYFVDYGYMVGAVGQLFSGLILISASCLLLKGIK